MRKLGRLATVLLLGAMLLAGCNGKTGTPAKTEEMTGTGTGTREEQTTAREEETEDMTEVTAEIGKGSAKPKTDIRKSTATKKYFTCTTNKDAVAYRAGEEIQFTFKLIAAGETACCPKFKYTVAADDGRTPAEGYVDGSMGVMTLKAKIGVAGFVHVQLAACDENSEPIAGVELFDGGAGADIDQIRKIKDEPADFDAFWNAQLKALDKTAPELIEAREVASPMPDFTVYAVKIRFSPDNTWGDYAAGYLSVPKNAAPGSLALFMQFNGASVYEPSKECKRGRITLCISPHSLELGQSESYYSALKEGKLKRYGFNETYNASRETVYFREMILRDVQAMRFLKTYFTADGADARFRGLWDGKNLTLAGGSQGGLQCAAVAALEPGATRAEFYCPWLCDVGGCGADGRQASTYMPTWTEALEYYDSVNFAKRIRCDVEIKSAGLGDYVATPAGVTAFYNSINPAVSRQITYHQNSTHAASGVDAKAYVRKQAAKG